MQMWKVIYTIGCSLIALSIGAQGLDSTLSLAHKMYELERYEQAIPFYERARFFTPSGSLEASILFKMGECYRKSDQAKKSLDYYDRAYFNSTLAPEKQAALVAKIRALINLKEFHLALAEIYAANPNGAEEQRRLDFFTGICFYANGDFKGSFDNFLMAASGDSAKINALNKLFPDSTTLYRPRPKLAKKLSFFLPGLGQFYSGDIRNGLNSLGLNLAFMALSVNVGINYTFFDALLAVFPWLNRYYLGGTVKAEIIAHKKRLENRQEFYLKVIEIFDNSDAITLPTQP
jgi:tetratricopeptide (TPR) repeat protein